MRRSFPNGIIAAILEADANRRPARLGVGSRDLGLNRNRHTKRADRPTDPRLTVIRFDGQDGSPLAVLVHYTAHPVLTGADVLKFSADYPGSLQAMVEKELKVPCVFIQGAAGDQSANPPDGKRDPKSYGELLGAQVLELTREIATTVPRRPSVAGKIDRFTFTTRVNFKSSITFLLYAQSFFPELIRQLLSRVREWGETRGDHGASLNGELAIVGMSGEPFCQHSLRLRQRAYLPWVLVFGYCNGHQLYFPTIEAASEGGYGADPRVSPIAFGAGETMIDRAYHQHLPAAGEVPGRAGDRAGSRLPAKRGRRLPQAPGAGTPANGPATAHSGHRSQEETEDPRESENCAGGIDP